MTPIHRIAQNMAEDATLRKMTRTEKAKNKPPDLTAGEFNRREC